MLDRHANARSLTTYLLGLARSVCVQRQANACHAIAEYHFIYMLASLGTICV
jgi:hypothetical protein